MDKEGKKLTVRLCCLGHTMDVSFELLNAAHLDVNDASVCFNIWTEDVPGSAKTWYLVLPNLFGKHPDTKRDYLGVAIKLSHGVLISWDGRVVRHCTSERVGEGDGCGTFLLQRKRLLSMA